MITGNELKQLVIDSRLGAVPLRPCSICNKNIGFRFSRSYWNGEEYVEPMAFMDTTCDCVNYSAQLTPMLFDNAAAMLNDYHVDPRAFDYSERSHKL